MPVTPLPAYNQLVGSRISYVKVFSAYPPILMGKGYFVVLCFSLDPLVIANVIFSLWVLILFLR